MVSEVCIAISFFVSMVQTTKKESQKTTIDGISHLQIHLLFQIGELSELRGNRIHQFDFQTVPQNAANLALSVKLNPQVLKSTAWSRETTHIQSNSFFLD